MARDSNDIKIVDKGAMGYLPLLVPIAVGLVVVAGVEEILLPLAAIASIGWAWRRYQRQKQRKLAYLNEIFYRLVKENQGRVTVLDLAMKANVPGSEVQKYLNERAIEFSAHYEISEQGGMLYHFETAFSYAEYKPSARSGNKSHVISESGIIYPISFISPLTQVELAKRLNVHPTTVSKWKTKPEFLEWSRSKDPEAIAWKYDPATKRFAPHA